MPTPPFTTDEIRQSFLEHFSARGCHIHTSASLVPADDPTTLFTVAGMSQFKDMFLGRGSHPFTRATTCQKCLRTNDILRVGRTPRHHTFFEMLGNFSFNDYFKREAIHWAWEYLIDCLKLDINRLSVTVHRSDQDAYDIWHTEIGLPESRIQRLGDEDNFWPANAPIEGPTGPGGCCSEIYYDTGVGDPVEIWNLVFPQFNVTEPKLADRYTLQPLGRNNVDTGAGLERLACVVQGKTNNFEIDTLSKIVHVVANSIKQDVQSPLVRRIVDHIRAVSFCITDGAMPNNIGRGYVVRRLIRRATLDMEALGVHEAMLSSIVVDPVVTVMGTTYPELLTRVTWITSTIRDEEVRFRRTLKKGHALLQKAIDQHKASGTTVFSGDVGFDLYTTYGFPPEITEEIVVTENLTFDRAQFDQCMQEFSIKSRAGKTVKVF